MLLPIEVEIESSSRLHVGLQRLKACAQCLMMARLLHKLVGGKTAWTDRSICSRPKYMQLGLVSNNEQWVAPLGLIQEIIHTQAYNLLACFSEAAVVPV